MTPRLLVLAVHADIADLRVGHGHELARIGGLGEDLLIAGEGGVEAAPGSTIEIHESRIKVAPPTDILRDIHNIRGIVAVENPEAISFIAKTDEIIEEEL